MHVEPKPNSSLGIESCLPEKKHLRDVLWLTHESFKSNACDHTQGEIRPPSSLQHTSHSVLPTLLGKKKKNLSLSCQKPSKTSPSKRPNNTGTRQNGKTYKLQSKDSFDQLSHALLAPHARGVISN